MLYDTEGSPLVEIFSVTLVIDNMDDAESADIEGTFQVVDVAEEYIDCFKRVEGTPSVLPDGTLSLTGPFRCIEGVDWGFNIDLKELKKDVKICNGRLIMGGFSYDTSLNEPVRAVIPGDGGYAVVNFMRFRHAAQATVEISLNNCGDDEDGTGTVHGCIWAIPDVCNYTNAYNERHCKVTLFNVCEEKPKKVEDGTNVIPLSRSSVAVPVGSELIIDLQLFQGSCVLVEDGYALFEARVSGEDTLNVGAVTLKVSWAGNPFTASGLKHPFA